MSQTAEEKRMDRAKRAAEKDLADMGYGVVRSDNEKACLVGFSSTNVRVVRIVLDSPSQGDQKALRSIEAPPSCTRELWIRRSGSRDFDKHKI